MKRKMMMALITASCLAVSSPCAVFAEAETAAQETDAQEDTAAEEPAAQDAEAAAQDDAAALSDDLYDFQVEMEGVVYQFPMTYSDFVANGWVLGSSEDPATTFSTNSFGFVTFEKGGKRISAELVNLSVNELTMEECLVGGLSIDAEYQPELLELNITLPNGIVMGTAAVDDIKAAYGEPSDTYDDSELYTKMTYEKDTYQSVEFYVSKESNTLTEISIENLVEPEGFDQGEVSGETPEIVSAYTAPTALGENIMDPVVEFCGDLYQLPAPVSAFEANGWELQDVTEEDFVAGNDLAFLDMMRDNQTVRVTLYNLTGNAVSLSNCFITELELGTYDPETITLVLSGNITLGSEKADIIAAAEELGYVCEENDDYLNIYQDGVSHLDKSIQIWFNADESETAAASITYSNSIVE